MKKYRGYDNIAASIVTAIFLIIFFVLGVATAIYLPKIHMTTGIVFSIMLFVCTIMSAYVVLRYGFTYWEIDEHKMIYKSLLKKTVIQKHEVISIVKNKQEVFDFQGGTCCVEAYIVSAASKEIIIAMATEKQEKKVRDILHHYGYEIRMDYTNISKGNGRRLP